MYAVIKDRCFTGTVYDNIKAKIIQHHHEYGETIIKINRKLTYDDEGNVEEVPTEEELENEITEDDEEKREKRLKSSEDAIIMLMDMNLIGGK